ncbi:hypothetical protein [Acrocarpospora pleiomorpha]|nr:hypothetical protein [Acrocarpospora pleiomorpha]
MQHIRVSSINTGLPDYKLSQARYPPALSAAHGLAPVIIAMTWAFFIPEILPRLRPFLEMIYLG